MVETQIMLVSGGHLAEMCKIIRASGRDWHFPKAGHEAAYRKLPLEWGRISLAGVSLRSPQDGRWYGFTSRTVMFGAISAVIYYAIFPRIIAELTCRIFGTPLVRYFDDFGALLPATLAKTGLEIFTKRRTLLGMSLKPSKSEVGADVTILGLGDLPLLS